MHVTEEPAADINIEASDEDTLVITIPAPVIDDIFEKIAHHFCISTKTVRKAKLIAQVNLPELSGDGFLEITLGDRQFGGAG